MSRSRWELEHDGEEDLAPLNNECLSPSIEIQNQCFINDFFFRDIHLLSYSHILHPFVNFSTFRLILIEGNYLNLIYGIGLS